MTPSTHKHYKAADEILVPGLHPTVPVCIDTEQALIATAAAKAQAAITRAGVLAEIDAAADRNEIFGAAWATVRGQILNPALLQAAKED